MALDIPLPEAPPGGFYGGAKAANALTQQNLQNEISRAQAKYAPYTAYADAASKIAYSNMIPYQTQATLMSNPLIWMALQGNKEGMNKMIENFQKSMPNPQQMMTGTNMPPSPDQMNMGGNPLSSIWNAITGGGQQQPQQPQMTNPQMGAGQGNALTAQPPAQAGASNYNPLLPGASGPAAAIGGRMTAPYNTSPYEQGKTIHDPVTNEDISVPSPKVITKLQSQLSAGQRLVPQFKAMSDAWAPFFTIKDYAKLLTGGAANLLGEWSPEMMKRYGDLPSKYADAKAQAFTILEGYLNSIGVTPTVDAQAQLREAIVPHAGENKEGYQERIRNTTARIIKEFIDTSKEQLRRGYNITKDPELLAPLQNDQQEAPASSVTEQAAPPAAPKESGKNYGSKGKVKKIYDADGNFVARGPLAAVNKFLADHAEQGYYIGSD